MEKVGSISNRSKISPKPTEALVEKTDEIVVSYEINGHHIKASVKEFRPLHEVPEHSATLFLPGWSAGGASTLENLSADYAQSTNERVFQITTRTENSQPANLMDEARAIHRVIRECGLKEVTLMGHSQGGAKAANLIQILQKEDPEVSVHGLILLNPVGIYEQTPHELVTGFATDALLKTPAALARKTLTNPMMIKNALVASSDIIFNICREIGYSGVDYIDKLRTQISEMAEHNNSFGEVRCPVVLIQGADDPISSPPRTLSEFEHSISLRERDKILRETIFPNAPRVDYLVASKLGNHGLPHFRREQIAHVAEYLLRRGKRRKERGEELRKAA